MYYGIMVTNDLAAMPSIIESLKSEKIEIDIICKSLYSALWIGSTNHDVLLINTDCADYNKHFEKLKAHAISFNSKVAIIQFSKGKEQPRFGYMQRILRRIAFFFKMRWI